MPLRKFIKEKTRNEEWDEIKNEPYGGWYKLAKRWYWSLVLIIILIIFLIVLFNVLR
jgi:hypothetical protein